MKSEPVVIVFAGLAALFGVLEFVPLPGPWGMVAKGGALVFAALAARSQVSPAK